MNCPNFPQFIYDIIARSASGIHETGGYIIETQTGVPLIWEMPNVAINKEINYQPDPLKVVAAHREGKIVCFYHTHVRDYTSDGNATAFSPADINQIWASDIPWLVYAIDTQRWDYFDPNLRTDYLGRKWERGLFDCYTLVRDFYRWELGIELPVPHHNGSRVPWRQAVFNEPLERFPSYFDRIEHRDIRPFDLLLFQPARCKLAPTHMGLWIEVDGNSGILHHPYPDRSEYINSFNPASIHSIWRPKCTISPSKSSANWAHQLGVASIVSVPTS